MPNYKQMYLTMIRASEKAINILIEAQRKCEEMYISDEPPKGRFRVMTMEELARPAAEQEE